MAPTGNDKIRSNDVTTPKPELPPVRTGSRRPIQHDASLDAANAAPERRRILVQGIVQGVGFRPFVYALAHRCGLMGYVRNDTAGVTIEVEGAPAALAQFLTTLQNEPPPLARIGQVTWEQIPPIGDRAFLIHASHSQTERHALVAPDVCTCDDCRRELFDPHDRRFRYPFINCTNCGPRFTIIQDVPYDRAKTTMRIFPLCPVCQAEYDDPYNRRFHAQPNACPACGPTLDFGLWTPASKIQNPKSKIQNPEIQNPIVWAAQQLATGAILAIKGLGGYHLACDAGNEAAVSRLRQRKHREAKPFALMVPDLATARQLCEAGALEAELLQSRQRPIVLLPKRVDATLATDIAPNYPTLGLMLPYTPLHELLLEAFAAERGRAGLVALVMTSGNLSDEPIAYQDDEAAARLSTIADGWLAHNRAIHMRCDDSVVRVVGGAPQLFRRARGYVPAPIRLSQPCPLPLLACGGHLKNTFCLVKEELAFVSHHIGDLENLETLASFRRGIEHFQRLFAIDPQAVAYDLHPDYLATKHALALDLPHKIGVQHHHAHIASVVAEHGLAAPVIGVAADGTGYGLDGAVWGGEILLGDLCSFERLAHLAYLPLPGGEQAIRQPWRMAAVYLHHTFGEAFLALDLPIMRAMQPGNSLPVRWRPLAQMIERKLNSPPTSSLGRLFDAVAALLGVRLVVEYEGQAAIELEAQAEPVQTVYPFTIVAGVPAILDVRPAIRAIVGDVQRGVSIAQIAGRFHNTVAELLAMGCEEVRQQRGVNTVALSGGVFQNRLLLERLLHRLQSSSFQVYINRLVPPNDGGLSLGQAAIAAARLTR
jgi:hydrogenase maturation protein HypF